MIIDWLRHHLYFTLSSGLFCASIGCLVLSPRPRWPFFLSAALSIPSAVMSLIFIPAYWNPKLVLPFVPAVEDFLFSLSAGGIVWVVAIWPMRDRLVFPPRVTFRFKRYVLWWIPGVMIFAITYSVLKLPPMFATLIPMVILMVLVCAADRRFWPLAISGAVAFGVLYATWLLAIRLFFPALFMAWTSHNLCGVRIAGIPVEEFLWSAAYGGVWPCLMAHVFDVQIQESRLPFAAAVDSILPDS